MTKKNIILLAFSGFLILMGCSKKAPSTIVKNLEEHTVLSSFSATKINNETNMRLRDLLSNENHRTSIHTVTYPYDDFGTITTAETEMTDTIQISFIDGTQRIFTNFYDTCNTTGDNEINEYRKVAFSNINTKIVIIESTSLHDEPTYKFYSPANSSLCAVSNPSTITLMLSHDICINIRDSMLIVVDFAQNAITSVSTFNPNKSQLIPLESDSVSATFALTPQDAATTSKFVRIHRTGEQWITDTIK